MSRIRVLAVVSAAALAVTAGVAALPQIAPASAAQSVDGQVSHNKVVSTTPAAWTPQVRDGSVRAITQVGDTVVAGGDFTTVRKSGSSVDIARKGLVFFTFGSGQVTAAAPVVDGRVETLLPGKKAGTVWVGGAIKSINGVVGKVFLLNVATGAIDTSFKAPGVNSAVDDLTLVNNQLVLGGTFTAVGGQPRGGLASLDADKGTLTDYMRVTLTEHHNYNGSGALGSVGVQAFDVSPDLRHLAVVGNFEKADGLSRDQIAVLDLGTTAANVKPDWATNRYTPACYSWAFDSYMRGVQWAPNGETFVATTTGGPNANTLCDTAATWRVDTPGTDLREGWQGATGGDSLWGVTATNAAIYLGGHQRWMNNTDGRDSTGPGAVPRAGIAALDPLSGVPNSWNPGRNPRGQFVYTMYATGQGVFAGSDTDYIGDYEYFRPRIAFFPLQDGTDIPKGDSGSLPGTMWQLAADGSFKGRTSTDGTSFTEGTTAPSQIPNPAGVRGATLVDGILWYGSTDGYLHKLTAGGNDSKVDPYNDPKWSTISTRPGGPTYRGALPEIYSQWNNINGMEYRSGRLYFTRSGDNRLFWTGFSPDSGIIEPFEGSSSGRTVSGTLTNPGEIVVTSDSIIYTDTATGALWKAPFDGKTVGTSVKVGGPDIDGRDWRTRGLTLEAQKPNVTPTAAFTASTDDLQLTVDASGSSDSDGTINSYSWDFGDGSTGTGETSQHTYSSSGTYTVTLTVTDDRGGTDTQTKSVKVIPSMSISYVGSSSRVAVSSNLSVNVPAGVQAGDTLVAIATSNVDTPITTPSGAGSWSLVNRKGTGMNSAVFVATASGSGGSISFPAASSIKMDVRVLAYRGSDTASALLVQSAGSNQAKVTSPTLNAPAGPVLVLEYWAAKSSTITSVGTPTGGVVTRISDPSTGSGRISVAVADSGSAIAGGGTVGGNSVTFNATAGRNVSGTLVLNAK